MSNAKARATEANAKLVDLINAAIATTALITTIPPANVGDWEHTVTSARLVDGGIVLETDEE